MSDSELIVPSETDYEFTDAISQLKTAAWDIDHVMGWMGDNMEEEFVALMEAMEKIKLAIGGIEIAHIRSDDVCAECGELHGIEVEGEMSQEDPGKSN